MVTTEEALQQEIAHLKAKLASAERERDHANERARIANTGREAALDAGLALARERDLAVVDLMTAREEIEEKEGSRAFWAKETERLERERDALRRCEGPEACGECVACLRAALAGSLEATDEPEPEPFEARPARPLPPANPAIAAALWAALQGGR